MTFDFHPEAEKEFLEAIAYYESCATGLGEDFSLEVYSTIQNILSYSQAWPIVEDNIRRCLTSRFPYGVLYSIELIASTSSRSCISIGTRTTGSPDDRRAEPVETAIIH